MFKRDNSLIFFFLLFCQTLFGQTRTLQDALVLTLLDNPELATFNYDLRAADARILQAGFHPNPALDVEMENLGVDEGKQATFLLSQLLELGCKRNARIRHAYFERNKAYLDYEVKKRELFLKTALLFIETLVNQQRVGLLEENLKTFESLSSAVSKRLEAGKASVIEETNFKVLITTTIIDLQKAKNALINSKQKLAAQWGEVGKTSFDVIGDLNWTSALIGLEYMGEWLHEHPQVLRLQAEEELRAAKVMVEKSKAYPDMSVRGGPRFLFDTNKWAWVIGLYVPLPLNDRNQGRILESYAFWEKLEKEREAVWTELLSELNQAYTTVQATEAELKLMMEVVIPAAKKAFTSSYEGYLSARYSYLDVLESERSYRGILGRYLQSLEDYHKALSTLEGLTGTKAIFIEHFRNWDTCIE